MPFFLAHFYNKITEIIHSRFLPIFLQTQNLGEMCKIHVTNHFFTRSPSTHYSWFPSQQISILSQFEVNVKLITCYLGGHMLPRTVKLIFILWSGRTTGKKMDVAGEGGGRSKKVCVDARETVD